MGVDLKQPIGTEKLDDEDWCLACKKEVKEWNVYMEDDGEGGYEKIYRCPHCRAKALSHEGGGCVFFLFMLLMAETFYGLDHFGFKLDDDNWFISLIAMVVSVLLAVWLVQAFNRLRYLTGRPIKTADDLFKDPFETGDSGPVRNFVFDSEQETLN